MASIAKTVEKIIRQRPFLQESMAKGIINYGALAELLVPEVEQLTGKKAKTPAVMMALRRFNKKNDEKATKIEFSEDCNIMVRDGLIEITIDKNKETREVIRKLFDKVDYSRGDVLTTTQGVHEITIITNKKYKDWLLSKIEEDKIITLLEDLSALTLTIPLDFVETPGFFYLVTRELAWKDINIDEIVSTTRELTLIIKSEDVPMAFPTIKELVKRN